MKIAMSQRSFSYVLATYSLLVSYLIPETNAYSYAALGDSYPSGDGAGSSKLLPNFDALCGRFSDAYPVQIGNNTKLNVENFRNLACGGAITTSVLKTQVPFTKNSDLITIQVGGNEVDFFLILNECVHQWKPLSTCDNELNRARSLVQSTEFLDNFDALVSASVKTMKPGTSLLILGYARFFNDETVQCDQISFSHTNPSMMLSKSLRRSLNSLILLLNDVIRSTSTAHGATYVDIDSVFDGHRFCEEGVTEPAVDASWFFTDLPGEQNSLMVQQGLYPSQRFLPNPFKGFTNLTRTFHPNSAGHTAIAKSIIQLLHIARMSQ